MEEIYIKAIVTEDLEEQRFDVAAAELMSDYSRGALQAWIKSGDLTLDGKVEKPKVKVVEGQVLELKATLVEDERWAAEDIPIDIVYEDESVIVVNKPVGLVVHPGAGNTRGTLINGLLHHEPKLSALPRAGVVHRIDKDTSGILVVAKTLQAHKSLVEQLQEKSVFREYHAICNGCLKLDVTIDAPIGRHKTQRIKMSVVEDGKPAVTHIEIKKRFQHFTWVKAQLETGRTHQIRVHMSSQGYPLIGDLVYGKPYFPKGATPELRTMMQLFKRQALHAYSLGFVHPKTGDYCEYQAPLPDDMQALIAVLEQDDGQN